MKHLLMSSSHLKRLSMSLIQVFELDTTDIKIIEERTRWIGHGRVLHWMGVFDHLVSCLVIRMMDSKLHCVSKT